MVAFGHLGQTILPCEGYVIHCKSYSNIPDLTQKMWEMTSAISHCDNPRILIMDELGPQDSEMMVGAGLASGSTPRAAQFLAYFTIWVFMKDFLWRKCLHPEVLENAYLSLGCRYVNSKLTLSMWEESVRVIIILSKYSGQTFDSWRNKLWLVDSLRFLPFPTFGGPLSLKFSLHSHQRPLRVLCWPQNRRKLKGFWQSNSGSLAK